MGGLVNGKQGNRNRFLGQGSKNLAPTWNCTRSKNRRGKLQAGLDESLFLPWIVLRKASRKIQTVMEKVNVYMRGWLGYFGIASIKTTLQEWDGWLRRRYRCYIWKQWKKPKKRAKSLIQMGIPEWQAWAVSNCRKAYWHMAKNGHVQRAISTEKLAQRTRVSSNCTSMH